VTVASLVLDSASRHAFLRMAADFRRVLGERFVAFVAYEPDSAVVFGSRIEAADLDALSALTGAWHRDGLETPLVMTPDEFRRSLDTFPLEYQAILRRHVLIAGADPFGDVRIGPEDLRRACEVLAKAHLIHLREGWLESAGHPGDLAKMVARSAAPLRLVLTNLADLNGLPADDAASLAAAAERLAGIPAPLVTHILSLDEAPDRAGSVAARLPEYLAAAEQLWRFIDQWRAR